MKSGDKFQGVRLKRRLDNRMKKYRKVFLCEGEKEVLTVYKRSCTPSKMCFGPQKLPLEYQCYIKFNNLPLTGLPRLLRYGYDENYVWLITEYISLVNLLDYMDEEDILSEEDFPTFKAYVGFMKTFFQANRLLNQTDIPLCISPENIFFCVGDDGLMCYFTGLDTMLFPSYGAMRPEKYYDTRYLAPEIMRGEYTVKSISYSYALSVLSVIKKGFPLPVPEVHYMVQAEEMVNTVKNYTEDLKELGLPEPMYRQFRAFIEPDYGKRLEIMDDKEFEAMCLACELENNVSEFNCEERRKMIMDSLSTNPFNNCFKRTEGRGLYDVGGMKEVKTKIQSLMYLLRHPEYAKRLNLNVSNILLVGPPGTGKSFIAKKLAEHLGLPYFLAHTSDMVGSYHGDNARSIRDLFNAAKENAPCLLILDEVDCAAQRRNAELSPGALETCNELLVQTNECSKEGILVVATTNSIENIDPAFLRAGRFDNKIYIGYPDDKEKESILRCVMRDKPNTLSDEDYSSLVEQMSHFVAADIASVAEQVCNDAFVEHANSVFMKFFEAMNEDDRDKQDYLRFVEKENETVSEESFETWCMINNRTDLKDVYAQFVSEQDNISGLVTITYEMMLKRIKEHQPSSSTQLEREYAQKYQAFLPERERAQARIGFNTGPDRNCTKN